jgi:broad specificity phosphatase PhoE
VNTMPAGRRLYLLRHGEAAVAGGAGAADPWQAVLTTRGRAEIGDVAEALAGCGLDLLVTSAVPRALETAAILGGRTGLRPVVDEGWNELRAGRVLAGSADQVRRAITDAYRQAGRPGARFLGGESFVGFAGRVEQALGRILAQPGWARAAVVTHEPALRHVLARCHGLGLCGLSTFDLATGSASVLEWAAEACGVEGATVRLTNGTPSDLRRLG